MSTSFEQLKWIKGEASNWVKVLALDIKDEFVFLERLGQFYVALVEENSVQNLTRLSEPKDFIDGHLLDVLHLEKSGYLSTESKPFDLGSGGGVPGLLHAFLFQKDWTLCDSEKQKAAFLARFCADYSLRGCTVVDTRAEEWLATHPMNQIVARAVGSVSKIFTWIERCSTWNQMILLKGPNWEMEWADLQTTRLRGKIKIAGEYSYTVGEVGKIRKIILLEKSNVPRGT